MSKLSEAANEILSALNKLAAWFYAIASIAFAVWLALLLLRFVNIEVARVQTGTMQDMGIMIAAVAFALRGLR